MYVCMYLGHKNKGNCHQTNSPFQNLRECIGKSMENMLIDVRV